MVLDAENNPKYYACCSIVQFSAMAVIFSEGLETNASDPFSSSFWDFQLTKTNVAHIGQIPGPESRVEKGREWTRSDNSRYPAHKVPKDMFLLVTTLCKIF